MTIATAQASPAAPKQRKPKGQGSLYRGDGYWVFQIRKNGKRLVEYITAKNEADAAKQAKVIRERILGKFARNEYLPPTIASASVKQVLDLYVEHLRANTKTAKTTEYILTAQLHPVFGARKASSLTTQDFKDFRAKRLKEGVSDSTVNRELAYLRAAFNYGKQKQTPPLVGEVPYFPMVKVNNVRQGFLELEGYERLLNSLPLSLKCLFVVTYHVGNRKTELTRIKWSQVDLKAGVIVLNNGETKNNQGRHLPIYGDMKEWLVRQRQYRDEYFPDLDLVFFRFPEDARLGSNDGCGYTRAKPGDPLKNFGLSWKTACDEAGCEGLLFHDLRRSAVRNMTQKAGLSESRAMKISGQKTRSMLDRYNIVSISDVQESGEQLGDWMASQREASREAAAPAPAPPRKPQRHSGRLERCPKKQSQRR